VPEAATQVDGARVFLKAGDQVSIDTLLQAMLLQSASDATLTLVTATDGSETAFVARMNSTAKRLGMSKTHFMNATGLTEPGHESSARDLALLGRALVRDFPSRQAFFTQKELAVKGITYYNGNRLLWRDSTVTGLKVGLELRYRIWTARLSYQFTDQNYLMSNSQRIEQLARLELIRIMW